MILGLLVAAPTTSLAHKEYQKEFLKLYAGREHPEFRTEARRAKCLLCHQGEEDRKNCNRFGLAMAPHLVEEDRKDREKIVAVIKQVVEQPSEPTVEDSPTFGELIAGGIPPGGPLEECKKEPESSSEDEPSADDPA